MAADPAAGDWSYQGFYPEANGTGRGRIFVVPADVHGHIARKFGGTRDEPEDALRELSAASGLLWGYSGGGPTRAAEAILADALELPDLEALNRRVSRGGQADSERVLLRNDFLYNVISQLGYEWRLRRGAVLRWVRGWYAEHGLDGPPAAVLGIPYADPHLARNAAPPPEVP